MGPIQTTALAALAGLTISPVLTGLAQGQPIPAPPPVPGGYRLAMLLYPGMTALDPVGQSLVPLVAEARTLRILGA